MSQQNDLRTPILDQDHHLEVDTENRYENEENNGSTAPLSPMHPMPVLFNAPVAPMQPLPDAVNPPTAPIHPQPAPFNPQPFPLQFGNLPCNTRPLGAPLFPNCFNMFQNLQAHQQIYFHNINHYSRIVEEANQKLRQKNAQLETLVRQQRNQIYHLKRVATTREEKEKRETSIAQRFPRLTQLLDDSEKEKAEKRKHDEDAGNGKRPKYLNSRLSLNLLTQTS